MAGGAPSETEGRVDGGSANGRIEGGCANHRICV